MGNASKIMMIRPVAFGYNAQTAGSNAFQEDALEAAAVVQQQALREFDALAALLRDNGVELTCFDDTPEPHTPDSIFPNNWISFHSKYIILYPMMAENRRTERRQDIIDHFKTNDRRVFDLSAYEQKERFLEGTGSIVFDYEHRIAYANSSPRTDASLVELVCKQLNYRPVIFKALDKKGRDIYHTNVLLCIGKGFAVVCRECIPDANEASMLIHSLEETGHSIIPITYKQMNAFAGNMYQLFNAGGESLILMSERAFHSLERWQIRQLEQYGTLLFSPLYTIEKYGGGSARCMIAEIV